MNIGAYELRGGGACPEQYDVFLEGLQVAYFRLRHGRFTATLTDPYHGEECLCVYSTRTDGDGILTEDMMNNVTEIQRVPTHNKL